MNIFKNVGAKDETKVDKQRARMRVAATERTKSDKAEETDIWLDLDETGLAYDDLQTTEDIQITHPGNHLSHRESYKFPGQEKVNLEGK